MEQQGTLLAVAHRTTQPDTDIGDKRGIIKGFTRAARLRMLKAIARIDWDNAGKCLFVSLTHPDDYWPKSPSLRSQQRAQFIRDAEKEAGRKLPALWRVEWKPRLSGKYEGQVAPHYHFVIFSQAWINAPWISEKWAKILGYPGYVQTDIELLESAHAATMYAAKYCGKKLLSGLDNDAYPNNSWGRCWGFLRKALIPVAPRHERLVIPQAVVEMAQDMAAEQTGTRVAGGFCLLNKEARRLYERLEKKADLYG